ncbi:MbcA/ParS/Xre antitoxin family protein [Marinimicrobium agarilyticum]|uniref:MbcA/ParS/Xre antitoxin family protein n=1 Tax=Marinimicrobium agarilyticum TaxID=306546 RepID=UPI000417E7CD|nr:MbcA/ParS/Xre antitoxin family protein [Marinimicrobium agarilyticum]
MDKVEAEIGGGGERVRIERLAVKVFGGEDSAGRWMSAPCKALRGLAPRRVLNEPEGVKTVEELLYRIDAGFSA